MGAIVHRLRITINGHAYDVTVEDLEAAAAAPAAVAEPGGTAAPLAIRPVGTEAAAGLPPRVAAPGGAPAPGEVRAPLPGVVIELKVQVGQQVTAGQVLLVLEAMKMDNEIAAPRGGSVREVRVGKGEQVAADQVLLVVG